jgi:hypothetical protein
VDVFAAIIWISWSFHRWCASSRYKKGCSMATCYMLYDICFIYICICMYVYIYIYISQVLHIHGTSHDYKSKNGAVPFIFQLNPCRNACHRLTASAFVTSVAGGFVVFPKSTIVGYLLIYWNLEKSWENLREIHHFGWIFSKSSMLGNPPCVVLPRAIVQDYGNSKIHDMNQPKWDHITWEQ